ncbi:MAG: hypothetical protein ACOCX4_05670, partial [Planctomycetota bacterium]
AERRQAAVWERRGMEGVFAEVSRRHASLWADLVALGEQPPRAVRRLRTFVRDLERIDTTGCPARFAYGVDEVCGIADHAADALADGHETDYYRRLEELTVAVGRLPELMDLLRAEPVDLEAVVEGEFEPPPPFEAAARELGLHPLGIARADGVAAVLWRVERLADGRLAATWLVRSESGRAIDGGVASAEAPGLLRGDRHTATAAAAAPVGWLTVEGRDLYPPEGALLFRQIFPAAAVRTPARLTLSLRLFFAGNGEKELRFAVPEVAVPDAGKEPS